MDRVAALIEISARQAEARAERRAATLPVLAAMAGAAGRAEIEQWAGEMEERLAVIGVHARSPLRALAEHLPAAAGRVAAGIVAATRAHAAVLHRVVASVQEDTPDQAHTGTGGGSGPGT